MTMRLIPFRTSHIIRCICNGPVIGMQLIAFFLLSCIYRALYVNSSLHMGQKIGYVSTLVCLVIMCDRCIYMLDESCMRCKKYADRERRKALDQRTAHTKGGYDALAPIGAGIRACDECAATHPMFFLHYRLSTSESRKAHTCFIDEHEARQRDDC